jgi:CRP-like cAMP-binding protein
MSLILKEERTAHVETLTYCDVFVLRSEAFDRLHDEYPEFRDVLKRVASERTAEQRSEMLLEGIVL